MSEFCEWEDAGKTLNSTCPVCGQDSFPGGEAFLKCRETMEKQLDYYDLECLYRHCGNNPKKAKLRKMLESR